VPLGCITTKQEDHQHSCFAVGNLQNSLCCNVFLFVYFKLSGKMITSKCVVQQIRYHCGKPEEHQQANTFKHIFLLELLVALETKTNN